VTGDAYDYYQLRRPAMLLWLESFSSILSALAMLLLRPASRPASRCQVLPPDPLAHNPA